MQTHLLHFVVLFISLLSCNRQIHTHLSFKILNMHNEPIEGAAILIDDQLLCTSNNEGYCTGKALLSLKEPMSLKIKKDSPDTYYENVDKTIRFQELRSSKFFQEYKIYTLPKAEFKKDTVYSTTDVNKSDEINEANDISIKTSEAIQEVNSSLISESETESKTEASTTNTEITSPEFKETKELQITIQSLHQNENLKNVDIFIENPISLQRNLVCNTNHRGRCIIQISKSFENHSLNLIAYHEGFKKEIIRTQISNKKIVRFNMQKGENHEIKLIHKSYNSLFPITNAKITVSQNNLGNTDSTGSFLLDTRYLKQYVNAKIQIHSPGYIPSIIEVDPSALLQAEKVSIFTVNSQYPSKVRFSFLKNSKNKTEENFFRLLKNQLQMKHGFEEVTNYKENSQKNLNIDVWMQLVLEDNIAIFQILSVKNHVLFESKLALKSINSSEAVNSSAIKLSDDIYKNFPFELTILKSLNTNEFVLNINHTHPIELNKNEEVYILDSSSQIIGKATISDLESEYVKARILELSNANLSELHGGKVVLAKRVAKKTNLSLEKADSKNSKL